MTLDRHTILGALKTSYIGRSLEIRKQTASTMDDALVAAGQDAPDGHVVIAETQTKGRGSHGRSWSSNAAKGLYFSVLLRPRLPLEKLGPLTLAVGLAIRDVVERTAEKRTLIKWPNDIWIDEKKCAGILVETRSSSEHEANVIVGVGLNVHAQDFDGELQQIATSIDTERNADRSTDRNQLFADLLLSIEHHVTTFVEQGAEPIVRQLDPHLALKGDDVIIDDLKGKLAGVSLTGAICIQTDDGVVERYAGQLRRSPDDVELRGDLIEPIVSPETWEANN